MITKAQLAQAQSAKARVQLSKKALANTKKTKPVEDDISLAIKAGWYTTGGVLNVYKGIKNVASGIVNAGKDLATGVTARINND
jgi:hypothetical protein